MKPKRILIRGGRVITADRRLGDFERADVLIEGATLRAVQPDIAAADAQVIDATGMIVMPGLVDAHRHTWQAALRNLAPDDDLMGYLMRILVGLAPRYRPEDVYVGTLAGALEALDAGITTLFDWSHIQNTPEHTDAAVDGLRTSGIRAVFGYGYPSGMQWVYESTLPHPADARRVRTRYFPSDDALMTMAMALRGPEGSTLEVVSHDWALARELGLHISVHVGNGPLGAPYRSIPRLDAAGLLGPDTQYVHNVSLDDAALERIRDTGGTAVVTPAVEMQMGFGVPPIRRLLRAGLRPGLGVDVVTSAAGDLFTQMHAAFTSARLDASLHPDQQPVVGVRDVLEFATLEAARAMWLDHRVGSLTPGKQADVVLLRTDGLHLVPVNDALGATVLGARASDVDTVLVAGRVVKRRGRLVGVDLPRLRERVRASRDYVVAAAETPPSAVPAGLHPLERTHSLGCFAEGSQVLELRRGAVAEA